ncbi:MAG: hypothetical protein ACRBCL_05470 [Maritimibacter sp.]
MTKPILILASLPWVLMACQAGDFAATAPSEFFAEVPEGVLEIAAPYQDLTAVKIDPVDGCYVYRHVGPVETTFLPLRATNGRPICSRAPGEATS